MNIGKLILFILLFTNLRVAFSQAFYSVRRDHDLMVTVGTGVSTYFGDLKNPGENLDRGLNLIVGAQITPAPNFLQNRLRVRSSLTWFRLEGSDATANDDRVERNLNFYSHNIQLTAAGQLNVFASDVKYYKRPAFNLYGLAGIGLLYMNPKTEYKGERVALQPLQTENVKYSRFQFVIPYGFGMKFAKGPLYNIALEAIWHKTFTDYLDDVSGPRYTDPSLLTKGELAIALSDRRLERDPFYFGKEGVKPKDAWKVGKRGNAENNDTYLLINLKVDYYLPIDLFQKSDKKLMRVKQNKPRTR